MSENGMRVVQRVVLPPDRDLDVLPLYVDGTQGEGGRLEQADGTSVVVSSGPSDLHPDDIVSRRSVAVRAGERLSFGSYFNAFPASYWRRWTDVGSVRLSVRTTGHGSLIVYRSNARGAKQRVDMVQVEGSAATEFDLTLAPFGDGGWYWFDLVASREGLILEDADWQVAEGDHKVGSLSIAITTFNRPDFCVDLLRTIAADDDVRSLLDQLFVIDQGTQKVSEQQGFSEVSDSLEKQLCMVEQANLGGSGGFSRGMYETVTRGLSDYVLLLDDDIVLEPEGVLRLAAFADVCRTPTIVGGHMFDMYNKSVLHAFGEIVDPWRFQPALPVDNLELGHDFARTNLRAASELHRRVDVDYNGWWMCLIPTDVIRELGLSLPLFIKWDDAEYGLRARDAGYPTVSLPGTAVWHVSWIDKDDLVGWQSYFHERNRVIAALMYSPYDRGGRVLRESTYMDVKHLISMQYYTERGRLMAMQDILAGPSRLHEILPTKLGEVRAIANDFPDGKVSKDVESFPTPRRSKPPKRGKPVTMPNRATLAPWALKTVARQLAKRVDAESRVRPQTAIQHQDSKWWRLSQYDSALVSTAEGTGTSWYKRDPRQLRQMLTEGLQLHAQLLKRWPRLREQYRESLRDITSFEAWRKTFGLPDEPEQ